MSFKIETVIDGEYENKNPDFKSADVGEKLIVRVLEEKRTGVSQYGTWYLFSMLVNGEECTGFLPSGKRFNPYFLKHMNEDVVISKELYKDKKGNDGVGWQIKKDECKDGECKKGLCLPKKEGTFVFDTVLSSEGDDYTEKEVVEFIKTQGRFDDVQTFIDTWKEYGSSEERAKIVFEHRSEL